MQRLVRDGVVLDAGEPAVPRDAGRRGSARARAEIGDFNLAKRRISCTCGRDREACSPPRVRDKRRTSVNALARSSRWPAPSSIVDECSSAKAPA